MWVTQKATHKARVSRTEVTGHLASCWGQFHHFCMQTDVWVNGRSYVKKNSEPVPLSLFPSNIPSKGEGRTALPRLCRTHSFKAYSTLPSSGSSVHPNHCFHPFVTPLSRPLHSGSSMASCKSPLLGHTSLPKSKARVYAFYSCLMSRERGLSGGKL